MSDDAELLDRLRRALLTDRSPPASRVDRLRAEALARRAIEAPVRTRRRSALGAAGAGIVVLAGWLLLRRRRSRRPEGVVVRSVTPER